MDGFSEDHAEVNSEIKCKQCGANLAFKPGTVSLVCEYCGTSNDIFVEQKIVEEIDYVKFLEEFESISEKHELSTVKCANCGASTTFDANVASDLCPYCSTPLVIKDGGVSKVIRPKYLLPFKIERKNANDLFESWVKSLWFAPNSLKKIQKSSDVRLKGVYLPFWTYDAEADSSYGGLRGTYYYVTKTYTVVVNGRTEVRTRRERRTSWTSVSGEVHNSFDDLLVCSSNSLPRELVASLEPWDLQELVGYDDQFLSGFVTESYQIDLKNGFELAKGVMKETIYSTVRHDIGGDEQIVHYVQTNYEDITFKHILLPLWISAYRFNGRAFRFLVNARTGEVQGERPYSAWKITFFVLAVLVVLTVVIYGIAQMQELSY